MSGKKSAGINATMDGLSGQIDSFLQQINKQSESLKGTLDSLTPFLDLKEKKKLDGFSAELTNNGRIILVFTDQQSADKYFKSLTDAR